MQNLNIRQKALLFYTFFVENDCKMAQKSPALWAGGFFLLACQDLGCLLGGDLLHRFAAALDAAVLARAIDQDLDHCAALFAKHDLIHIHTSLFIKSLKQADQLVNRIKLTVFQIPCHAGVQMLFQNVRRQALHGIFHGG
jgi:hypothetical protein